MVQKHPHAVSKKRSAAGVRAKVRNLYEILYETYTQWSAERAPRMAAALAFYTVFSLAPLLIIVVAIAGLAFGEDAAQGEIVHQIEGLIGRPGAEAVQAFVASSRRPESGILATIVGLAMLVFGATGVFVELQDSLNTVWNVKAEESAGFMDWMRLRFVSFSMVIGVGFLLLVSLVLSAGLAALAAWMERFFPDPAILVRIGGQVLSFLVITLLFAILYRMVPDAEIRWRDVWPSAVVTAILFSAGKLALGVYLGRSAFTSTFGAAASVVVILLWVYYSAQIFLFGAELMQVSTTRRRKVRASAGAAPWAGPMKPATQANVEAHGGPEGIEPRR